MSSTMSDAASRHPEPPANVDDELVDASAAGLDTMVMTRLCVGDLAVQLQIVDGREYMVIDKSASGSKVHRS